MIKVEYLTKAELEEIGETYANYNYPENDKGMFPFDDKELLKKYIMGFAIETADRYKLPLIIDTDEGVKRDKYCHLGVHQVTGRDFGDSRYSYGMIRECGR